MLNVMVTDHSLPRVRLRNKEEYRIQGGHPWVFSNEVEAILGSPEPGEVVEVLSARGKTLGVGFYHPHSLIAVRMLSRLVEEIGPRFFRRRLEQALEMRRNAYAGIETWRLVHGEGDFLPGLIVDKFEDMVVVQTFSLGMDKRLPLICDVLEELFHPAAIVERNESPLRTLEELPERSGVLRGTPDERILEEHGLKYVFHPLRGQKTGFFLDQRENRLLARRYAEGARVLDCFCNDGGFALNASRGGARAVAAIDSSQEEIDRAIRNAALNDINGATFHAADVFTKMGELNEAGEKFDMVILDPPSFTRTRKSVPAAKRGYRDLHEGAFKILRRGGLLLSASCSHHIEGETFQEVVLDAARRTGRTVQLLDWRGAAPDHPSLPGVPETRYLKMGVFRIQ